MAEHRHHDSAGVDEPTDTDMTDEYVTDPADSFAFMPFEGDPYRIALQSSVGTIATALQDLLTRRLTAYTVGIKDAKTISRWANQDVSGVQNEEVERKLRTTYQMALMLLSVDAPPTVKAWFVGMNPYLNDQSPVEAIRSGREREALDAARAFVASA